MDHQSTDFLLSHLPVLELPQVQPDSHYMGATGSIYFGHNPGYHCGDAVLMGFDNLQDLIYSEIGTR